MSTAIKHLARRRLSLHESQFPLALSTVHDLMMPPEGQEILRQAKKLSPDLVQFITDVLVVNVATGVVASLRCPEPVPSVRKAPGLYVNPGQFTTTNVINPQYASACDDPEFERWCVEWSRLVRRFLGTQKLIKSIMSRCATTTELVATWPASAAMIRHAATSERVEETRRREWRELAAELAAAPSRGREKHARPDRSDPMFADRIKVLDHTLAEAALLPDLAPYPRVDEGLMLLLVAYCNPQM